MADFTHLHVHSHYSLLDGLGKIRPMLAQTRALDMDSIALTDHGVMYGIIEFVQAAREAGVKPIIGVEAYVAPKGRKNKRGKIDTSPRHITLLAQNNQGYKNLLQLTTKAHLEGYYYKPRLDYELLEQHADGLIVLSGCLNSDIARALTEKRLDDARSLVKWHLERFGRDRYYLEVQRHDNIPAQKIANEGLISLAAEFEIGLIATADTHYIHPEDAEAHDVLICVQTGKTVQDKDRMRMLDDDFSLKSPAEMKKLWRDHPQAIENSQRISDMCTVDIEFGVNRLPRFPLPKNKTADEYLRELCLSGLEKRYGSNKESSIEAKEEQNERLDYELSVIKKTGYASYFLIVADFVNEAKDRGILVGPGRGSVAGSLVSYAMNITNIDPLAYNLLFERFLNPERVSMPDIDIDFADDRRDEVIQYVREKYGHEHVAQIITFGTMAARAAVRDAGRALGLPYAFCDKVAKAIPAFMNFNEALKTSDLKMLYDQDPAVKKLIDTAMRLEGVARHASTHAAGVVITDEPLVEYVPLQLSLTGDESAAITQYAMYDVEALGLLKMDFLGLKNLTIIQNTLARIKKRYDLVIDLDGLPLNDTKTYALLQEGKSTGVFQLESSGMKRYLRDLKPTELEDLISMVSLYRPGPMESIPDFIAAKHGRKKIKYLHPLLQPILEKTYGVIVTQDQVLQIARVFAGFSYAEADILRKAVGKKIKSLLDEQRDKFIKGAIATNQVSMELARKVWDFIEPFARYGFNRAHAACYALISYQTAYLKANYPAEFMAALLTSDEGNIDRAAVEIAEVVALGLTILPPDINESDPTFTVVDLDQAEGKVSKNMPSARQAIRFGLAGVKNVGQNVVSAIITERSIHGPFKDLSDLFARVESRNFNRKSVESLARAGAFDLLGERQQILTNIEALLEFNRSLHRKQDKGQKGLFGSSVSAPLPRLTLAAAEPASKEDRLKWEKELLGIYVSEHPLSEYQNDLAKIVTPVQELSGLGAGRRVRIAGVTTRIKNIMTKANQPMLFVEIEDMTGTTEILVFSSTLAATKSIWLTGASLIIEGKLSDKDGESKILTDKVWPLTREIMKKFVSLPSHATSANVRSSSRNIRLLRIQLPAHFSKESLQDLQKFLVKHKTKQGVPVELTLPNNGSVTHVQTKYIISADEETLRLLRKLVGLRSVSVSV